MSYYAPKPHTPEPDLEIDLHGVTTAEAKIILDELIENAVRPFTVNIIVGKGKNSPLGPVLPSFVRNYLTENNLPCDEAKSGTLRTRLT